MALTLAGGLTACTGSSGEDGGDDTKPGGASTSTAAAPPGKYRTLPEPCGAVDTSTLKKLLPGAEGEETGSGDANPSASPYEGEPTVTYDTDRRVGCRWKSATTLGTRHLTVNMERVVSYDPAISDDEQAEMLYDEKAAKADIPASGSPSAESDADSGSDGDGSGEDSGADSEKSDSGSASPSPPSSSSSHKSTDPDADKSEDEERTAEDEDAGSPSPGDDLSPRVLTGIGDTAYIDDQLDTADSGVHRDITLVFRTANVIATVEYDQWVTDKRRLPDSAELQEKAQSVARELAEHFSDN
ncbi:hypothetical protein ACWGJ2_32770 [Streptomyces sp. NPDC054796]